MLHRQASFVLSSLGRLPTHASVRHCAAIRSFSAKASPVALVFDTETTGLQDPYPVQLGMILVDTADWNRRAKMNLLIQLPQDVSIHPQAQKVHGISGDACQKFGIPAQQAAQLFDSLSKQADILVAHNMAFDARVMEAFLSRELPDSVQSMPKQICTMHLTTPVLKLPRRSSRGYKKASGEYKSPSLQEAYSHFHPEEKPLENAHDAMVDAEACLSIFRGLVESGAVQLNAFSDENDKTPNDDESPPEEPSVTKFSDPFGEILDRPKLDSSSSKPPVQSSFEETGNDPNDFTSDGFLVTGYTYGHKDTLKKWGAKWMQSQKAWAFNNQEHLDSVKKLSGIQIHILE